MRVLVHGDSLPAGSRLWQAAAALALRGHEVLWWGRRFPATAGSGPLVPQHVRTSLALARARADVVVGGPHPLAVAMTGWLARAPCMVLALDPRSLGQWRRRDHWAWSTLRAFGLVEPSEAGGIRSTPGGIEFERLALWSDETPATAPDVAHLDTEILERACERALARHRGSAPRAAVFLDRDGTLIVERGYLSDPDGLELLPGVPRALQNLRAAGFALVVISNQAGVGRGLFPLARAYEMMARLRIVLRGHGVELDAIYFCPHRPEEACSCRKPGTALLERAAEDLQLSLRRSIMVGDKRLDVETGRAAGGRGILVRTGYGREEEHSLAGGPSQARAAYVADDLPAAAEWILHDGESIEGG